MYRPAGSLSQCLGVLLSLAIAFSASSAYALFGETTRVLGRNPRVLLVEHRGIGWIDEPLGEPAVQRRKRARV
jgi:hypothetical protein